MSTQTLNASAAQSFFSAAQGPQKPQKRTRQELADRALANQYKPAVSQGIVLEEISEKEERTITSATPYNPVQKSKDEYDPTFTKKYWGEKTTELLEAENESDPRWVTEAQAKLLGGKKNGIQKQSGVLKECLGNGVQILSRMPKKDKKGEIEGTFGIAFVLYNVKRDCWGILQSSGGTLPDMP